MGRSIQKNSELNKRELPANTLGSITTLILLFGAFIALTLSGIVFISNDIKILIINFLNKHADNINNYRISLNDTNQKCIFILIYSVALIGGFIYLGRVLYFWFRTTEFFDVPLFGERIKSIPKIKNKFYREDYIHTRDKVIDLGNRNRKLSREANQQKGEIEKLGTKNRKLEDEKNDLTGNLEKLIDKVLEMDLIVQLHSNVTGELLNLMSYVLMLKNISDPTRFSQEFQCAMDEFANALIKVTADRGCDKCSSIMMIPPNEDYLKIVGSNGLKPASKNKLFKRGQGFEGSIFESGQTEICNNVDEDPRFPQEGRLVEGDFKSIIGVPIKGYDECVVGALFIHSRRLNVFDEVKDKVTLSYFSALLAIIYTDYYALFKGELIADGENNRIKNMA